MGKCLGKQQTPPANYPMALKTEKYQEKSQSQQIFVKEQIHDKNKLKIGHKTFVTKRKTHIRDNYDFISVLGDGNYGKVSKAMHKSSKQIRAIKQIDKSKINRNLLNNKNMLKEIDILKQLDHPNIVKLYEIYEDIKYFYLVTELCEGGELFQKIIEKRSFDEYQSAFIMKQLFSAVQYLHVRNIVHRDLKPENLVLQSADQKSPLRIKLIDFGTSQIFNPDEKMGIKLGTPYYIAPEVINKQYTYKCDIWSCGVIMYILLSGKPPFAGKTEEAILQQVQQGRYDLEQEDAKDLIRSMLQIDPDQRPSTQEQSDAPDTPFAKKSLKNLKGFKVNQKLQRAVVNFIASQLTTQEERQELENVFKKLDINNDGKISTDELIKGLQLEDVDLEVKRIMKEVDSDASGFIEFTEFISGAMDRNKLLSQQKIMAAFHQFDLDKNGKISQDEVKQFLEGSRDVSDTVWEDIIREVDVNGDGEVSFYLD